jgi:hypothetical protein
MVYRIFNNRRLIQRYSQIPPEDKRKLVAKKIYNIFCDNDADCWDDAMKLIKDGEINLDE